MGHYIKDGNIAHIAMDSFTATLLCDYLEDFNIAWK